MKHIKLVLLVSLISFTACISTQNDTTDKEESTIIENPTNKVKLSSEIAWQKLNPARGDKSPQAGTIWGDRRGSVTTGFLAKFIDGFSSPPHIHNVTYRAVVIKGLVHNDDENAENMWMKPGSFWTQPAGEPHITAAKGEENIAIVEISRGPYLVKPTSEAFDNGERPINIDVSNIVWLDKSETNWIDAQSNVELSFLLEDKGNRSLFVKLPKGFKGQINTNGSMLHSVVISGELKYTLPQNNEMKTLDIGSYFGATSKAVHTISNSSDDDSIIYIRTNGTVKISE